MCQTPGIQGPTYQSMCFTCVLQLANCFRSDPKVVLSSANDGYIIAWGSGGGVVDKILVGIFSMLKICKRSKIIVYMDT